ncbi:MAG: SMC-Scp complex subunit ScpB [Lachnospiraceae bacterium]|nr:SMC-Scp complex subunit ScpB [Lachnospiraceae bacterium]
MEETIVEENTVINHTTSIGDSVVKHQAAIEAILFSMGDAVSAKDIAKVLELDEKDVIKLLVDMMDKYEAEDRGIRLVKLEDSYQLCTKNEYYDILSQLVNMPKKHNLTDSLMETLSIIAYKQPVTRQEIEAIRGVSCVHAINKLVEYKLVAEVGRLDAVGRPILFGTTEDFLRSFGVTSMDELPVITPDKIEDFKQEAMEEAQLKIEV